jgi:hypothetical protein
MCAHAGYVPLYVSENRDWEQYLPGLVDLSGGCDYTDLIALSVYGGRRYLESHNDEDTSFPQAAVESGPDYWTPLAAFATAVGGSYEIQFDDLAAHNYTEGRLTAIVNFFDAA